MSKKLYVGNLPHEMNNNDLQSLFETHGAVSSAHVIFDRDTRRSKGFGFVEMETQEQAQAAIEALNGTEVKGRKIIVNEAIPKEDRPRKPGGSFRGNNGGRRY